MIEIVTYSNILAMDFTGTETATAYYNQLSWGQASPLSENDIWMHCTFINQFGYDISIKTGIHTFKNIKESIKDLVESNSGKTNLDDIHIYIINKDDETHINHVLKTTELLLENDDIYISKKLIGFGDDIDEETLEQIRDEYRRSRIVVELTGDSVYPLKTY
jgi:hypothetical protein